MSKAAPDLHHLVALVEAARVEASRSGPVAEGLAIRLGEAAREAKRLLHHGSPDEGLRPDELNTENDE